MLLGIFQEKIITLNGVPLFIIKRRNEAAKEINLKLTPVITITIVYNIIKCLSKGNETRFTKKFSIQ